jgi:uncharacterized repeat protein (TIGR01451 family)
MNMKHTLYNNAKFLKPLRLFFAVLCLFPMTASAQTMARYSVTQSTGNSYSSISVTGAAIPSWRNISGGNFNLDDNRSYPVDIGFDFWYRGVRYTQFSVSTNGYLDFSSSTANGGPTTGAYGYDNAAFTNNTALTATALAVFYDDQTTQGVTDPLGEGIKYSTTGVAPNRVLTVEWINMAVYGNTAPDLNYQVKVYESSGEIQYNYSTMTAGGATYSYTIGMNGPTQTATATASELLTQQAANGATFNNTERNNLATLPISGYRYAFAPPSMNAPHTLSFTGVSQNGMTLNWTDTLWNEVGFVVYASSDGGATYNFITQTASDVTSYALTGLLAGTTYYVKVYAVNEGRLSSALTGNQMTLAAGAPYTIGSGSWKNSAIWSTGSVPGISDNATIADGTVVLIDSTVTVNSLTVGQGTSGTLLIGDDNTARSITVIGNITVNSGAVFRVNAASNTSSHTITTSGNIDNSGIFVMAPDANSRCAVTFNKNGTQTISGAGDSTFFYLMTVNLGSSRSNMLDIFATNFADTTVNFLTLTNGTFNLATGATITPFTAATTITSTAGIRVNHSSAVVSTRSGSLTVAGEFKLTAGTVTIGSSTGHDLVSTGGIFEISGGTLNVRGGFIPSSAYATTKFTMSGGTMTVADSGSTNTTYSPMNMSVAGSEFTMSGGTIIIKKEGGTGAQDLGFSATGLTSYSVTGGTIQFGSGLTPAAQVMRLNSTVPLYNVTLNSSNATVQLITNNVTVQNNVTITAGTLNLNALTLSIAKDWSNSGTLTAATGKVIFNGSGAQSITNAAGETFNRLTINKSSGTVSMIDNVTVTDSFALSLGTLYVGTDSLKLNGIVTGGGTLTSADAGTVNYNGNIAGQTILAANYGNLTFSNFTKVLPASTVGISNVFTSGTAAGHTVTGNTIEYNGAGAQNIAAFLYNNVTLTNGGVKTQLVGADSVLGNLSVGVSNTLTISSADTMRIFGNVYNAGIQDGTNYLELRGSVTQSMSGGGSFTNVKINNANGVTLSGNSTINGVLRLLTGVISTGTDTLTIASGGSVSRNSGHVNGWLKKNFAAGSSVTRTYELGDAAIANYTPIVFNFATVSGAGDVAVTTVASEPDNLSSSFIDPTNNVNRYWQAVNSGSFAYTIASGCSITVTFLNAGDLDQTGTETSFRMNVYNGTRWDSLTAGTRTTTTNMATGVDSLGIYVVGLQSVTNSYRTKASGRWTQWWNTWERFNGITWVNATTFPKLADGLISVQAGHTVTIDTTLSGVTNGLDQLYIEAGGQITVSTGGTMQLRNGAGTDLTVLGTLLLTGTGSITTNGTPVITFASGGVYSHNVNGGNIISANAYTATWNASSTVEITGVTSTVPAKINQTFGNFIWKNSAQSASIALLGNPATVNGNFDIQRTNNQQLLLNDNTSAAKTIGGKFTVRDSSKVVVKSTGATAYAVTVGDSLVVAGTGSVLRLLTGGGTGAVTMTVSGHVLMAGDSLVLSGTATVDSLRISGNMTHSSGVITETGAGAGWIIFRGTAQQTYTSGGTVSNTVNYRVDGDSWLKLGPSTTLTGGGAFTLVGSGKLEIGSANGIASAGASGNIQVTGTRTFSSTAKYIYSGTASQIQGVFTTAPTARTMNYLEVDNAAGVTLSDSVTVTDSLKLVNGTLGIGTMTLYVANVAAITSGTLTSSATGTVNYSKGSNTQSILAVNYGNLILSNFNKTFPASTVGIAGTFTPGTATGHTLTGNTIDYNGSGAQSVRSWAYYNDLSVSGTNWKQLSGNATVNGNLSVSNGTLSDSIYTLTVKGNIANTSLNTGYAAGKTVLTSGTVPHALSGTGSYRILEMNDAYGATVSANLTIDSLLILTNGVINAGSNIVICSTYPGVTRTSGHIFGTLQKAIEINPTPQLYTFQVGDASNYTPIDVTFQSVTVGGTLQAKQTTPDHPNVKFSGLDEYKSVNRYFTLTGSGITFSTYDATMNFVSGDIDAGANTGYFFVKRYNASWNPSTTNIRNSTSTKTTGITAFGEFAVGEAATTFYWTKGAGTYNWGDDYNWSSHSVPTAGNSVVFDGKDTIEVNVNAVCNNLTLHNDTLILTIRAGKTLTLSGNLSQYSGLFSSREAFPTVSGSISLSGGTFGYDSSAGTQTVAVQSYHHLQFTGGGTKIAAGPFTVNHNLTIGTGATFDDGGATVTVKDSISNSGQHSGTGKILLDGAVQHGLSGSGSFTNLQLNNSSNGATVTGNLTVNGALTLTSGIVTAVNDTLGIGSTGSIVRTSGFVNGNLKKYFAPAADSLSFEVGTASVYLPVTVSFGTVTTGGSLTLQMVGTEHPDIANSGLLSDSTVNRYWILKNNGIAFNTVNVTFNWLSGDLDAGIATYSDLLITKKDNGVWSDAAIGTITATSIRAMSLTSFSEFAVGKASSDLFTSVVTGNWSTAATWDLNRVPKKRDKVRIVSPHVVTLVDDREINSITVNSGAEFADGGYTLDLYGLLSLSGRWSGTGRIRWNDSDADSLSGTGGKVSGTSTLYVSGTGKLVTAVNDTLYRIQIGTGNTVTNLGTVYTSRLIGDNGAATWTNASGSSLFVSDTLLATGTLTATASPNTVTYYGTGAQSVHQTSYHHLTFAGSRGANSITLPSGTVSIAGALTSSATFSGGGFITTGNTIDYNGSGAQTVAPFDYRNLTVSGARGGAAVTFSSSDTIAVSGTLSLTATAVTYSMSGSIVDFNGTAAQSVPAFNYNKLRISGNRTTSSVTLAASDTIGVADSLSFAAVFSSGGYITTGSKIAYNGTGTQTVSPFAYNDLSISGTRNSGANVVFAPSDTVKIKGVLAVSSTFSGGGALVSTGSTVEFNGTSAQYIPAFSYNNLRISGARSGANSVTLAPSTINVAGNFSPAATFGTGDYIVTSNTMNFNGGTQTIPAFRYTNLQVSNAGTKSAGGTLRVQGNMTIGASADFNAGATTDTVYGTWTNSGTFTPSTSTIVFAGTPATTVTGATTFNTLVVNKQDSATAVTLANSIVAANVTMTRGTMHTGANSVSITSSRTGNGIILGTVTRTHTFSLATSYAFEGPNSTVTFTAGTPPSSVTMTVAQSAPSSPTFVAVSRSVNIAMTGGSGLTSTVRLHYENSEANSLNENIMKLWQYAGSWQNRSSSAVDSTVNYIEMSGLTSSIAGDWGIGSSVSSKTVSDINGGTANAGDSLLYTISITNPYNVTKNSILVTDPLDNNLIVKSGSISNSGGLAGAANNGNGSLVGGTITWPALSLTSGSTTTRTFKVNTDSLMDVSEAVNNTAAIDFGGSNIENVSASITITNIANITIDTNIVSHQSPVPGDTLVFTLKYRNTGTSNATTVNATYTIPGNTSFVTNGYGAATGIQVNGTPKTNAADADEVTVSGSTITIAIPTLVPGAYEIVKFKTIVN